DYYCAIWHSSGPVLF
nr:immunoglobulin light chain junction region [Macaca mulatta]MOW66255.1 immunoglobulin light chain junction region [Macaca mulatta]MOW66516.1 immunoglobulin light chain junction region [Macaca mulatta]MOW66715.1 immunoglobulin light chain junction region [Macaca mulatta]MOW66723.1 immunoglobulin light chain junction region [Macaca mulatta]